MCLATPMKIERLLDNRKAIVSEGGVQVEVDVSLLDNPQPGDHVIVHAGYAIETLTLADAQERLELFRKLAELSGGDQGLL
ncbi:MAG TPA: HypC/HybG/HupF family hydrogenase formation chaperone [Spirochaetia bacterium]|nr:HypC/HybG/HupF family hydrogenase formation chaperone [Spirochaetia bacterium]